MRHRILPERRVHPLHRLELLGIALAGALLLMLCLFIYLARLHPQGLTGRAQQQAVGTRVNVTPSPPYVCDYTLEQGTRLASFPCLPYESDRAELFANLSGGGASVKAMYRYRPSRPGKWEVYNASLPNYTVQTLGTFLRYEALYLVMDGPERFVYAGVLPAPTRVSLAQGWNLVGYVRNDTKSVDQALSSINTTYTEIKSLEGSEESGVYLVAMNPGGGTLQNVTIYAGYWINMSAPAQWVVE